MGSEYWCAGGTTGGCAGAGEGPDVEFFGRFEQCVELDDIEFFDILNSQFNIHCFIGGSIAGAATTAARWRSSTPPASPQGSCVAARAFGGSAPLPLCHVVVREYNAQFLFLVFSSELNVIGCACFV